MKDAKPTGWMFFLLHILLAPSRCLGKILFHAYATKRYRTKTRSLDDAIRSARESVLHKRNSDEEEEYILLKLIGSLFKLLCGDLDRLQQQEANDINTDKYDGADASLQGSFICSYHQSEIADGEKSSEESVYSPGVDVPSHLTFAVSYKAGDSDQDLTIQTLEGSRKTSMIMDAHPISYSSVIHECCLHQGTGEFYWVEDGANHYRVLVRGVLHQGESGLELKSAEWISSLGQRGSLADFQMETVV